VHYDGDALWKATCVSYVLGGNGYWRKVRNAFGDVIALWYIPHWLIRPMWPHDGSQFISHYDYRPGGAPVNLLPRDVVHFRFGLDPENPRLGLSPLRPLLREVFTDDEAAAFSSTILENMGVPGLVISPKDATFKPSPAQIQQMKDEADALFRGHKRGGTMVTGVPTEASQFGFDPNKLMLTNLRDISEERVCAALGIPAAVVGFGSGLQSTKVGATMRELRRLAWVQCLIPMQKSLAKQLTAQLLPDFVSQTRRFRMRFDTSDVSAFQEEDDLRAKRAATLVQAGILRVDRAQEMVGLEVDPTQRVYLRPSNGMPVGPDAPDELTPATPIDDEEDDDEDLPPAIAARMNGNGRSQSSSGNPDDEEE
jgi:HK97 family phage portal protein